MGIVVGRNVRVVMPLDGWVVEAGGGVVEVVEVVLVIVVFVVDAGGGSKNASTQ